MTRNFNITIWMNFKSIKKITITGEVRGNKCVPLKKGKVNLHMKRGNVEVTYDDIFEDISMYTSRILTLNNDVDVDLFMEPHFLIETIGCFDSIAFVSNSFSGDWEDYFIDGMLTIIIASNMVLNDDTKKKTLKLINAYQKKYRNIREELTSPTLLNLYDRFYEIVKLPRTQWVEEISGMYTLLK